MDYIADMVHGQTLCTAQPDRDFGVDLGVIQPQFFVPAKHGPNPAVTFSQILLKPGIWRIWDINSFPAEFFAEQIKRLSFLIG